MLSMTKDLGLVALAILIAIYTQYLAQPAPIGDMLLGGVAIMLIILLSMLSKKLLPSSLPLFAYATLVGILICLPDTPLRSFIIDYTDKISFLSCCVGLLAFAGLSVGGRVAELKNHSWKIVIIFLVVSTCCFFGAAIVAQIGFSIKGII